jgi:hypothetical protein
LLDLCVGQTYSLWGELESFEGRRRRRVCAMLVTRQLRTYYFILLCEVAGFYYCSVNGNSSITSCSLFISFRYRLE